MSCKGTLTRVKPKNGNAMWSPAAIVKFIELTKDLELFAAVKARDNAVFELDLFQKDFNITDFMVANGFADSIPSRGPSINTHLVRRIDLIDTKF